MATYAVGDIQGCFATFRRLLSLVDFDPDADQLWLAGDLVNRGPRSADVLRWCLDHEASLTCVLGNHDLHLLTRAEGLRGPKSRDTLDDVLAAPDRGRLIDFLYRQPFLHKRGDLVLMHAGLHPTWSVEDAQARASRAAQCLASEDRIDLLGALAAHAPGPPALADVLSDIAILTRIRTVTSSGAPAFGFAGPPSEAPAGQVPWFEWPSRASGTSTVVFGHWAALGFYRAPGVIALDSGCVWGQQLTAVRLDDGAVFQAPHED